MVLIGRWYSRESKYKLYTQKKRQQEFGYIAGKLHCEDKKTENDTTKKKKLQNIQWLLS